MNATGDAIDGGTAALQANTEALISNAEAAAKQEYLQDLAKKHIEPKAKIKDTEEEMRRMTEAGEHETVGGSGLTGQTRVTSEAYAELEEKLRSFKNESKEVGTEVKGMALEVAEGSEMTRESVQAMADTWGVSADAITAAMERENISLATWAEKQDELFGNVQESLNGFVDQATDGFNRLTQNSTISWDEYISNMEERTAAIPRHG